MLRSIVLSRIDMVIDQGISNGLERDSKCVGEDNRVHINVDLDVFEDQEWQHKTNGNGVAMQRVIISTNVDELPKGNFKMEKVFKKNPWQKQAQKSDVIQLDTI